MHNWLVSFFIRNSWLLVLIIVIVVGIIDINFNFFENIECSGLLGISISVMGFIFTILSIMLSLPDDNKYIVLVKKYGKDKELSKIMITAMIMLFITSVLAIVKKFPYSDKLCLYMFIGAICEFLFCFYYVYRIYRGYIKAKK